MLAYGLTAFWLVPSYFKVTAENMKYAPSTAPWSVWVAVVVAIAFAVTTDRLGRDKPGRTWEVFLAGSVVFFTLNVLGNYYFNFRDRGAHETAAGTRHDLYHVDRVLPAMDVEPRRWRGTASRWCCGGGLWTTHEYLMRAWDIVPSWPDHTNRVEYR